MSTGFCEELVYRGFGIAVLRDRGFRLWPALLLATLSNVFMRGLGGIFLFPVVFLLCLFLAGVFLWSKSLVPGIVIHPLMDMLAVFGPS